MPDASTEALRRILTAPSAVVSVWNVDMRGLVHMTAIAIALLVVLFAPLAPGNATAPVLGQSDHHDAQLVADPPPDAPAGEASRALATERAQDSPNDNDPPENDPDERILGFAPVTALMVPSAISTTLVHAEGGESQGIARSLFRPPRS